jgi:glutaredoxin
VSPLRVQVVTYAPTIFRHCQHCEVAFEGVGFAERIRRNEAKDALPDDLAQEFQRVSDWVHDLLQRHGPRVAITVIDAASIEGFWTSLRRGVRRFPAVIVDGRRTSSASDLEAAQAEIESRLSGQAAAGLTAGRKEVS